MSLLIAYTLSLTWNFLLFLEHQLRIEKEFHDGKDKTELKVLKPEKTVWKLERHLWNFKKHSKSAEITTRDIILVDNYLVFLNNFFFFFLVIEVQQYSSVIKWKAGSNTCSHNPQRLSWGPTALKMCCKQAGKANTDVLFQDLCKDLAVSTAKQDSRRKTYVWHMYLNL